MKCPKCGKEIANDSRFCEYCGARVNSSNSNKPIGIMLAVSFALCILFFVILVSPFGNKMECAIEEPADTGSVDSSDYELIYQLNKEISCTGKRYGLPWEHDYSDCSSYLYTEINDLSFEHFRLSFDFLMSKHKYMNILMLDSSCRIFGLQAVDGKILVVTDNYRHEYDTNIAIPQNSMMHVDIEYNRGLLIINNKEFQIIVENANAKDGDRVLSSIDFGSSISPFHGKIGNINVYNIND